MSLKNTSRLQTCQSQVAPNYPVNEFVEWASGLGIANAQVLAELDELQRQLDIEADALRQHSPSMSALINQQEYWCLSCRQVRAHYRMLLQYRFESH